MNSSDRRQTRIVRHRTVGLLLVTIRQCILFLRGDLFVFFLFRVEKMPLRKLKVLFLRQISSTMKKVLPLVLFVLLAFASCQSGPAIYEMTKDPREFVPNVEKFVNKVDKKSKHYSAEDWDAAIEQFVLMNKNYVDVRKSLTQEEQMKYDNARVKFMHAIDANGTEEMAKRVKEEYGKIMDN